MNQRMIVSFCLLVVAAGCKKFSYRDTEIDGMAVNLTDNTPLTDYDIHLVETETPARPFSSVVVTTIATTTTDASGRFSFDEELSKRNRFEYTVEFDPMGELFKPEAWQDGDYDTVSGKIKVAVGEANTPLITQIPNGQFIISVTNNSTESADFTCTISNTLFSNLEYSRTVASGATHSYNDSPSSFASGHLEMMWTISATNGIDTIYDSFVNDHFEIEEYHFVYP